MKKKILFIALFVASLGVINAQQLPNSNFEDWNNSKPADWNALEIQIPDNIPGLGGQFLDLGTNAITRSAESYSGDAAIKVSVSGMNTVLQAFASTMPELAGLAQLPIPGVASNGKIDLMASVPILIDVMEGNLSDIDSMVLNLSSVIKDGMAITQKPVALYGAVKANFEHTNDLMAVMAFAYSGTGEDRQLIGYGLDPVLASPTYKGFEAEITYFNSTATPSEFIVLFVVISTETQAAEPYSYMIVDDLNISYGTGINSPRLSEEVSVYPNPAKEVLNIRTSATEYDVQVVDMLGRVVITEKSNPAINISNLTKGAYFVKVTQNGTTNTEKIIIE
jgi:hypothetical protein